MTKSKFVSRDASPNRVLSKYSPADNTGTHGVQYSRVLENTAAHSKRKRYNGVLNKRGLLVGRHPERLLSISLVLTLLATPL